MIVVAVHPPAVGEIMDVYIQVRNAPPPSLVDRTYLIRDWSVLALLFQAKSGKEALLYCI